VITERSHGNSKPRLPSPRQILGTIRIVITLMLILTLKPDPYIYPTYPNKPTEPYQTIPTLTNTVGLQCVPSDRHTS